MKNKASMMSNMKRRILSSALAGTAVLAALALQPMTVLADTIESVAVTGYPEVVAGQDIPDGYQLANDLQIDNPDVYAVWAGWDDNGHNASGQFQPGHTYTPGLTLSTQSTASDTLDSSTRVTINGNSAHYFWTYPNGVTFASDVSYSLPAEEPAPAPAPVTPHDANEQAALQQQALERELQAAGVGAPAQQFMTTQLNVIAPNGNYSNVRNIFRQAARNLPGVWGVYAKAANGDTNAIYSLFNAAADGQPQAIVALYAAASDGNAAAIYLLQFLGYAL